VAKNARHVVVASVEHFAHLRPGRDGEDRLGVSLESLANTLDQLWPTEAGNERLDTSACSRTRSLDESRPPVCFLRQEALALLMRDLSGASFVVQRVGRA
jgi:hypothetical protein